MALELGHEWIDWDRERLRSLAAGVRRWVAPVLAGGALAGLFLVALRGNTLQTRYQLDASYRRETELTKERANRTATYWGLRSPSRLERAARGSFVIPECVARLRPDGSRPAAECAR